VEQYQFVQIQLRYSHYLKTMSRNSKI